MFLALFSARLISIAVGMLDSDARDKKETKRGNRVLQREYSAVSATYGHTSRERDDSCYSKVEMTNHDF